MFIIGENLLQLLYIALGSSAGIGKWMVIESGIGRSEYLLQPLIILHYALVFLQRWQAKLHLMNDNISARKDYKQHNTFYFMRIQCHLIFASWFPMYSVTIMLLSDARSDVYWSEKCCSQVFMDGDSYDS